MTMASAEIQKDTHISGVDSGSTEYRRKSKDDASGVDGSYQSDTESVSTLMRGRRRSSNNNNTNYAGVNYEYIAEVPLDKYYIVWAIVFLLGVGVLLPWNVFITETAYFNERVHVKPYLPKLANNFESLFATVFQTSSFITMSLYVIFQNQIPTFYKVPFPLFIQVVIMFLTVLSVSQRVSGTLMLAFTLPCLSISGIATALLQGGSIAMVAAFPALYMQAVMSGMALAGLLVSVSSFLACFFSTSLNKDVSADFNFICGFVLLSLCCLSFCLLPYIPFARFFLNSKENEFRDEDDTAEVTLLCAENGESRPNDHQRCSQESLPLLDELKQSLIRKGSQNLEPGRSSVDEGNNFRKLKLAVSRTLGILSKIKWHFAGIVVTFAITLSVFPGIIALVVSHVNTARPPMASPPAGRFFGDCFVPFLFVLFNTFDLLGRLAGGFWTKKRPNARLIFVLVCLRAALVPLICMCNIVSRNPFTRQIENGWALPVIFKSDYSTFGLVSVLGFTNGLPASIIMMHAPGELSIDDIEIGGGLMAWAIVLGVSSGSSLSLLFSGTLSY